MTLLGNFDDRPYEAMPMPQGDVLFESRPGLAAELRAACLPAWSVIWFLRPSHE